jgi:hypothetical protein
MATHMLSSHAFKHIEYEVEQLVHAICYANRIWWCAQTRVKLAHRKYCRTIDSSGSAFANESEALVLNGTPPHIRDDDVIRLPH